MSNSIPIDISFANISGIVTIDNKLYDCMQILQSLSTQGFPIKKYGSSLKIGNQVISPIPSNENIPVSTPAAQNIIQSQFTQLFKEISVLKQKINAKSDAETLSGTNSQDPSDSHDSICVSTEEETRSELDNVPKEWEHLIQNEKNPPHKNFDVGESNLQRKWESQDEKIPLSNNLQPDTKFKTEYYSLGMKSKKRNERSSNGPHNRMQFDEVISSNTNQKSNNSMEESSLEKLTEELVSRIEKNLVCPKCLNNLPNSAFFCSRCGLKVQKKELKIPDVYEKEKKFLGN